MNRHVFDRNKIADLDRRATVAEINESRALVARSQMERAVKRQKRRVNARDHEIAQMTNFLENHNLLGEYEKFAKAIRLADRANRAKS